MEAFYTDGKTSKRRSCHLTFRRHEIEISYLDDDQVTQRTVWEIEKVHKLEVRTESTRSLQYGDFPHQTLELEDKAALDQLIEQFPFAEFHQSSYNKFAAFGLRGILLAVIGVVAFSVLFFLYGAPMLAESFAKVIPEEYETYIGENIRATFLEYSDLDDEKSELIQTFYDKLSYQSKYDISVVVVESSTVNAFALPGGYIVVYSGILDIMESENELAGLLAHEASHINGRHSLRAMSRSLSTYLLLSILTGDVGGFSSVIIENSDLISSLSFSRGLEKNADMEGLRLMVDAGIDPNGMVELFRKFEKKQNEIKDDLIDDLDLDSAISTVLIDTTKSEKGSRWRKVTEFLSTHPTPDNRIEYLTEEIQSLPERDYPLKEPLKELFEEIKESK